MPELPDVDVYVEAVAARVVGRELLGVRLGHVFVLRTVDPAPDEAVGRRVASVRRLGKRVVIGLAGEPAPEPPSLSAPESAPAPTPAPESVPDLEPSLFLVIHLMVAGRLHWRPRGAPLPKGSGAVAFDFSEGSLQLTEAGKKRRASLHVVRGEEELARLDPGGIEVADADPVAFRAALTRENHTVKRALTDPRIVAGIGNAYSDEILHRAHLSPFKLTADLDADEVRRLQEAAVAVLREWTDRLRAEAGGEFPEGVTAFRPQMAVHGRFGSACPVCGTAVQRIVYAENECDYCPRCQTGGRILADRALSRLLKESWPKTVDEWERKRGEGPASGDPRRK